MVADLHPASVVRDPTISEGMEKSITGLNEVLAALTQRLSVSVARLSGPWPSPQKDPPKPTPDNDGNHLGRMSTLMSRQANLLSELEAITIQLEHYV